MTPTQREQLAALLARLVADGKITEEQAIALFLAVEDDGTVIDDMLPLTPAIGITRDAEADDDPPILLLLLGALAGTVGIAATMDQVAHATRLALANALADLHAMQATELAAQLADGEISVSTFQTALRTLNRTHAAGQTTIGAGTRANLLRSALEDLAESESAYLQRFADDIAGRMLSGNPMSVEEIARRARQYAGAGRAMFFRGDEGRPDVRREGWIIRYDAVDDPNTCSACHQAQGYYLPGTGPYPGEVCYGGDNCRCSRTPVYDPAIYARLTGGSTPAP